MASRKRDLPLFSETLHRALSVKGAGVRAQGRSHSRRLPPSQFQQEHPGPASSARPLSRTIFHSRKGPALGPQEVCGWTAMRELGQWRPRVCDAGRVCGEGAEMLQMRARPKRRNGRRVRARLFSVGSPRSHSLCPLAPRTASCGLL